MQRSQNRRSFPLPWSSHAGGSSRGPYQPGRQVFRLWARLVPRQQALQADLPVVPLVHRPWVHQALPQLVATFNGYPIDSCRGAKVTAGPMGTSSCGEIKSGHTWSRGTLRRVFFANVPVILKLPPR